MDGTEDKKDVNEPLLEAAGASLSPTATGRLSTRPPPWVTELNATADDERGLANA